MAKTSTSSFGTGKRESHDASAFYDRNLYRALPSQDPDTDLGAVHVPDAAGWSDRIECASATDMRDIPDHGVALAFTSPPYNVGKEYDDNLSLEAYLGLIGEVAAEVYRVLRPGGRYVVNVANLGRKPYIPLHALFYSIHTGAGLSAHGRNHLAQERRRQRQLCLGKLAER